MLENQTFINRSAFTYWDNKTPSPIDLGKQKYGGSFTEEEVEDTKTFWRIVTVLLSTFDIFILSPWYKMINRTGEKGDGDHYLQRSVHSCLFL